MLQDWTFDVTLFVLFSASKSFQTKLSLSHTKESYWGARGKSVFTHYEHFMAKNNECPVPSNLTLAVITDSFIWSTQFT